MLCDLKYRLGRPANATDSDISLDKLRSEGWRRWNTDMDIEYQYETFNELPVYYGGDKYEASTIQTTRRNSTQILRRTWMMGCEIRAVRAAVAITV